MKIKSEKMLSIHVGVLREDLHVRQSVHLDNWQKSHEINQIKISFEGWKRRRRSRRRRRRRRRRKRKRGRRATTVTTTVK